MLYTNLSGAITALVFCAVIHPLPEPSRIIGHTQNLATLLYAILGIARTLYDIYSADADVLASQANTTRGCLCLHTCQARLLGSRILCGKHHPAEQEYFTTGLEYTAWRFKSSRVSIFYSVALLCPDVQL
jgi:hypothetical protein